MGIKETELNKKDRKFNPFKEAFKCLASFFILVIFGELLTPGYIAYVTSFGFLFLIFYCFVEYGPKKGSYVSLSAITILGAIAGIFYLYSSPHAKKGEELYDQEKYNEAIKEYDTAIKITPTEHTYFHMRGLCYYQLKDYQKAEEDFFKCLKIEPEYSYTMSQLGSIYNDKRNFKKAEAWFLKALKIDKNSIYARYELARTYKNMKMFDKSIDCYKACLEIDSKDVNSYWGIAAVYEKMNRPKEAIKYYKKYQKYAEQPSLKVDKLIKSLQKN